jgi:DNA-binding response OmpR family regulator
MSIARSTVVNVRATPGRKRASLILADGDPLTLHRTRAILEQLDARIHEAIDCWEVMSLLLSTGDPFDLVISDLGLLRASGLDALLCARAAGIQVPFLFFMSGGTAALHARAARLGARILQAPVDAHELLSSVHQMCGAAEHRGPGVGSV